MIWMTAALFPAGHVYQSTVPLAAGFPAKGLKARPESLFVTLRILRRD